MKFSHMRELNYKIEKTFYVNLKYTFPDIKHKYFRVLNNRMQIKKGYAWDGATCAIDTDNFMEPSCIHDVLAQAIREGLLDPSFLERINDELIYHCKRKGMWLPRRQWVSWGVWLAGSSFIQPVKREIIEVE